MRSGYDMLRGGCVLCFGGAWDKRLQSWLAVEDKKKNTFLALGEWTDMKRGVEETTTYVYVDEALVLLAQNTQTPTFSDLRAK